MDEFKSKNKFIEEPNQNLCNFVDTLVHFVEIIYKNWFCFSQIINNYEYFSACFFRFVDLMILIHNIIKKEKY